MYYLEREFMIGDADGIITDRSEPYETYEELKDAYNFGFPLEFYEQLKHFYESVDIENVDLYSDGEDEDLYLELIAEDYFDYARGYDVVLGLLEKGRYNAETIELFKKYATEVVIDPASWEPAELLSITPYKKEGSVKTALDECELKEFDYRIEWHKYS